FGSDFAPWTMRFTFSHVRENLSYFIRHPSLRSDTAGQQSRPISCPVSTPTIWEL
ncbi:uncharacterized, partial [Tachysurus ichikawai]